MRVAVHAKPGARRPVVGGTHGDALIVAVSARAVDGAATEAILGALADALGVKRRAATLVSGATSRSKVIEIAVDEAEHDTVLERLQSLRG
ncbi:MAG: DUF167 domain-containing protein [Actinobacteria bacterium]|nr:DUF167 domain-containing protein [Actinomycetota bacterium]